MSAINQLTIISPHIDDAILSMAGYIIHALQKNIEVNIIYVFTTGENLSYYKARKEEEKQLASKIGYHATFLDLKDAPGRNTKHNTIENICFHTSAPRDITKQLTQLLQDKMYGQTFGPMAIGGHIDHIICKEAAIALHVNQFYADLPYAFINDWNTDVKKNKQPLLNYESKFIEFVAQNHKSWERAEDCHQKYITGIRHETTLQKITFNVSPALWDLKENAINYYHTEIPFLFGDKQNIKPQFDRFNFLTKEIFYSKSN